MREDWKLKKEQPIPADNMLSLDDDDSAESVIDSTSVVDGGDNNTAAMNTSGKAEDSDYVTAASSLSPRDDTAGTTAGTGTGGEDGVYESTHVSKIVLSII